MISDADLVAWIRSEPEDAETLRRLEKAAVAAVQQITGRYFGPVAEITETVRWNSWPLTLANEPIGGVVTSFKQWDGSAYNTVTTGTYYVSGSLIFPEGTWNLTSPARFQAVYQAGYPMIADPDEWAAPDDIQQAVLLLVGHWFENREAVVAGMTHSGELPLSVTALVGARTRVAI